MCHTHQVIEYAGYPAAVCVPGRSLKGLSKRDLANNPIAVFNGAQTQRRNVDYIAFSEFIAIYLLL